LTTGDFLFFLRWPWNKCIENLLIKKKSYLCKKKKTNYLKINNYKKKKT